MPRHSVPNLTRDCHCRFLIGREENLCLVPRPPVRREYFLARVAPPEHLCTFVVCGGRHDWETPLLSVPNVIILPDRRSDLRGVDERPVARREARRRGTREGEYGSIVRRIVHANTTVLFSDEQLTDVAAIPADDFPGTCKGNTVFSHIAIRILRNVPYTAFVVVARRCEYVPGAGFERDVVNERVVFTDRNHGHLHLVVQRKQTDIVIETYRREDELKRMRHHRRTWTPRELLH